MSFWDRLFSGADFMPRRYCGVWDDSQIALHVVSDVVIWLSYLWIPLVMLWTYRSQRGTLRVAGPVVWILILYVIFITACGWTHFFDALMFYNPVYRLNGVIRGLTAIASLGTAISLVRLMPLAVNAPITILTQQETLRQQHAWLRDILDSVTDGRLRLCSSRSELPIPPLGAPAVTVEVDHVDHLKSVRTAVKKAALDAGFASGRTGDIVTAAHEAAMNALVHAVRGTVTLYRSGGRLQIWIEDTGDGIPLDRLPISTLKQGYSTAGTAGQGWFLVLTLIDRAYLLTGANGTTLVIEMEAAASPGSILASASIGGDVPVPLIVTAALR